MRYRVRLIKQEMTVRGWNAVTLAQRAGTTPQSVRNFLSGLHQSPKMALKIAQALGQTTTRPFLVQEKVS